MMLLVIDIGNSHTVIGLFEQQCLIKHFRLATVHQKTADEYGVLLGAMLRDAGIDCAHVTEAAMASVVPPLNFTFQKVCDQVFGIQPLLVGPGIKTGMPIRYESPKDVGADRIVNGVAAHEKFRAETGGPHGVIIVDFGTATTFDVISPDGCYLGGVIAPGVQTSTEALFMAASKLPRVDLRVPSSCLGRSTVHSMQSGIVFGYVALVDGLIARLQGELDFTPKMIATGGIANLLAIHTQSIDIIDEHLTLTGLRIIHERNLGVSP